MTTIRSGTTQRTSRIAMYMLHNFHIANRTRPGPPERLAHRIQCWEEDTDAYEHPDNNKPIDKFRALGEIRRVTSTKTLTAISNAMFQPEFELQVPLPLQSIQPIFDGYVLAVDPNLSLRQRSSHCLYAMELMRLIANVLLQFATQE